MKWNGTLTSDAILQHFFGHIRAACGSSNHPDPIMFIQIYRLLTTYSLIKPPRGSNVSGVEILETLLEMKDLHGDRAAARRQELESVIDTILDGDVPFPECEVDHAELLQTPIDGYALTVFGGYIARKVSKMKPASVCSECHKQLTLTETDEFRDREALLDIRTRGGLLRPSDELRELLFKVRS